MKKKCDIFTEKEQAKTMAEFIIEEGTLLEPSVGEGNLLKFINLEKFKTIDIYDIEKSYLDKIEHRNNMNIIEKDFLKTSNEKTYDNIIMNPPYIKIQELGDDYIKFIRNEFPLISGNMDIYQAFILKALRKLNKNGILVSINPNSLFYNKSCKKIVAELIKNRYIYKIIDYGSKKVFKNIDVYTCIIVLKKYNNLNYFHYNNEKIFYKDLTDSIFLKKSNVEKLGNHIRICNGIATLRDKIFIHKNKKFEEDCWKQLFKVSTNEYKWIIFPYSDKNEIILEEKFKGLYPKTYNYLLENKDELLKRDNGKCKKYKWYEYGRSQGISVLNENDEVIYMSTISDINLKIYKKPKSLFINGLYIVSISKNITLDDIMKIIKQNRDFIYKNSTKRGSNWFNVSSTLIKKIPMK